VSDPIYIIAGGGTGGHLYPGLAVAGELVRLRPGAKVVFACSNRPIDQRILAPTPYAVVAQTVRPIPHRVTGWFGFVRAYLASAAQGRQMVRDLRPAAVLGLGGFAAGPVVCRAAKVRVRTALLNPDAVPGRANRLLARRVEAIFTQFAGTEEHFDASVRAKVRLVGCPVRREFATADRQEALRHFGLRSDRKTLLVNGGSQGASSINEAIARLRPELEELAEQWQVLHVVGPSKAGCPATAPPGELHVRVLEYCDRMDLAYAAADLSLSRAGAATVAELMASGTPAVLMPYPYHADQQQRLNAASLSQAGSAVICDDAKDAGLNAEALRQTLLPILRQADRLGRMRQAAAQVRPHDAAGQVAAWLAGERT
jgi:UDP-N-acetylglucosamine--N-acetylmuramyl-(pentapeptide) pyrophosphoryl-undecaprenol N-acetylglucosamine transferase